MTCFDRFNPRQLSTRLVQRAICCGSLSLCLAALGTTPSQAAPKLESPQPIAKQNQASKAKPSQKSKTKHKRSSRSGQLLQTLENLFSPPRDSAPKSTANSATRDRARCAAEEAAIQAMVPAQGYGLTASDRPAITLDLPPTSAQQVALIFRSESGELDHRAWLPIPQASPQQSNTDEPQLNLTQFQLPADGPGLQAGQRYRWSLVVICGEAIEPDDPTFMGWVEYRAPTHQEQEALTRLSAEERRRWYGQKGYWYDMVQP